MQISGTVQYVNGPSKYGTYNIKLNDTLYWTGKSAPAVKRGDFVQFTMVQKGTNFWVEDGSLQTQDVGFASGSVAAQHSTAGGLPGTVPSNGYASKRAASLAGPSGTVRFNDRPWDPEDDKARQSSIVMQHSQEMALGFINLLAAHDALVLPKSGKQADRYEYLEALRKEVTQRLYEEALDPRKDALARDFAALGTTTQPPVTEMN